MAWKYQDVLNADLAILFTVGLGFVSLLLRIFEQRDSTVFTKFLFKFTLPGSVILGLGLRTNLYDANTWRFIGAFLVMRAIMLAGCALLFGLGRREGLGSVTANWMSTTWISTVILGTPILKALLGPAYASLGVVAGVSSFIFQLPLMLILFEIDAWRKANVHARTLPTTSASAGGEERGGAPAIRCPPAPAIPPANCVVYNPATEGVVKPKQVQPDSSDDDLHAKASPAKEAPPPAGAAPEDTSAGGNGNSSSLEEPVLAHHNSWTVGISMYRMSGSQLLGIGLRLVKNHVLWGCLIGISLSLSKIGPKWLDPGASDPNCSYVIYAGFIYLLLDYFARCTEPVALFSTGMWMRQKHPFSCGYIKAVVYMLVKLVVVPTLMIGCAFALGLRGAYGRAAVLVAALPVSSAAFALCKTYGVGEAEAVSNVVLGNLLVLPTTIAWLAFMDAVNLFEVAPVSGAGAKKPAACTACKYYI